MNEKILILEDIPSDVELAKRELNSVLKNYATRIVDTEEEFIKGLKDFKPDLILSDYRLPAFDGLSALKISREMAPFTPFIILTGSMNEDTAVECMKAGADDYVIKEHIKRLGQAVLSAFEKKKIEKEKKEAQEQIKKDLAEKNLLLKELYHRTKNNMQVISSMIRIQARRIDNEFIKDIFTELNNKIRAMSLVHQKLYESQDLSRINLKEYISELMQLLMKVYEITPESTSIKLKLNDIFVLIDMAIPLSMVLNELISNIFKHAFAEGQKKEITIRLFKDEENSINIYLGDNGKGIPADMDLKKLDSMGIKTVFSLVQRQLKGEITYTIENGLKWHIKFKDNLYIAEV